MVQAAKVMVLASISQWAGVVVAIFYGADVSLRAWRDPVASPTVQPEQATSVLPPLGDLDSVSRRRSKRLRRKGKSSSVRRRSIDRCVSAPTPGPSEVQASTFPWWSALSGAVSLASFAAGRRSVKSGSVADADTTLADFVSLDGAGGAVAHRAEVDSRSELMDRASRVAASRRHKILASRA